MKIDMRRLRNIQIYYSGTASKHKKKKRLGAGEFSKNGGEI